MMPVNTGNERLRWIKTSLFSSWINTVLSLISLILFFLIVIPMVEFVFYNANWRVIADNFHLFLVGSYPKEQLWRIFLSIALLAVMIVFSGIFQKLRSKFFVPAWLLYFLLSLILLSGFSGSVILPKVESHLWGGLLLTLLVTVVGILFSFPLGVLLALGRRSDLLVIQMFCIGFIEMIRGVPMITLLFMGQVLIPLFLPPTWVISNLVRMMIAVTFFSAAYMAEYVRGGLQSLSAGQIEAAQALGLNRFQTTFFVVLPQAVRAVIPGLTGQCIALFKDTSLVAIVGLLDLTGAAKAAIGQADFIGLEAEVFMAIALVYWVFSFSMSKYSRYLEKQFGVGIR
ncbi:MAG: amino acid ABC transporter permease [Nitrospiria bacterium]